MKIVIEMTTGNEFFQTEADVAALLRDLSHRIENTGFSNFPTDRLLDRAGNTVGLISINPVRSITIVRDDSQAIFGFAGTDRSEDTRSQTASVDRPDQEDYKE